MGALNSHSRGQWSPIMTAEGLAGMAVQAHLYPGPHSQTWVGEGMDQGSVSVAQFNCSPITGWYGGTVRGNTMIILFFFKGTNQP